MNKIIDSGLIGTPITILDLGAMKIDNATSNYEVLLDKYSCTIIGFEPNEEECTRLKDIYSHRNYQFFPIVIGDGSIQEFKTYNYKSRSSLFEPNTELCNKFNAFSEVMEVEKRSTVKTTKLDELNIKDADFIKMDIQGAELYAIKGAKLMLKSIVAAEVEVKFIQQYLGQPLFSDIDIEIRKSKFMFHTYLGYGTRTLKPLVVNDDILQGLNQWLWTDAVYIKHINQIEKMNKDKLLKFAIIMHELYKSYDFAYYALNHYDKISGNKLAKRYLELIEE